MNRNRRLIQIAAAAALLLLVWLLWPSPYGRVRNIASPGSSVIAFGDSLTAGYGATAGDDYPSKLSQRLGVSIINAGVSGDTTESALARLQTDVLSANPRIVVIGLGGNDFLRGVPLATTEANLTSIVRQVQAAGAMAVVLSFTFPSLSANYEAMYERVAESEKALLIEGVLKGILRDPALKSDEIHPNARGYELMAERVSAPLAKLIRRADAAR